jgi:acetyltransferase-like isoleucine patch superfamily enzyme
MSLTARWRHWTLGRQFARLGRGCVFLGERVEIKGRVEAGSDCVFGNNLVLRTHKRGRITLGSGVELADYALLQINSELSIGDQSYIGPYVVLRDTNHVFQGTDIHWRVTPHITEPIRIGANCYLGAGTYVMPGVSIGDGAVVAPRSIVNRDIGPAEVWAGAPARLVAHRTDPTRTSALRRQVDLIRMFGFSAGDDDTGDATGDA